MFTMLLNIDKNDERASDWVNLVIGGAAWVCSSVFCREHFA